MSVYDKKELAMKLELFDYASSFAFTSKYKAVPFALYEEVKKTIDFTKYYVMFRGPRPQPGFKGSTRKRHAVAFDVYEHPRHRVYENRIREEAFQRGIKFAQSKL